MEYKLSLKNIFEYPELIQSKLKSLLKYNKAFNSLYTFNGGVDFLKNLLNNDCNDISFIVAQKDNKLVFLEGIFMDLKQPDGKIFWVNIKIDANDTIVFSLVKVSKNWYKPLWELYRMRMTEKPPLVLMVSHKQTQTILVYSTETKQDKTFTLEKDTLQEVITPTQIYKPLIYLWRLYYLTSDNKLFLFEKTLFSWKERKNCRIFDYNFNIQEQKLANINNWSLPYCCVDTNWNPTFEIFVVRLVEQSASIYSAKSLIPLVEKSQLKVVNQSVFLYKNNVIKLPICLLLTHQGLTMATHLEAKSTRSYSCVNVRTKNLF